jgi:hypothetical protein
MIEKLDFKVELSSVLADVDQIVKSSPWDEDHQIGLTHRPTADPANLWKDAVGSLHKSEYVDSTTTEYEFTELNAQIPETLRTLLLDFARSQNIKLGRVRIMRALPKRGLTVHRDTTVRYHLVLKTNIDSFFGFRELKQVDGVAAKCYHMPANGHFYKVDTTKFHFIYNGGKTERIHLVIVPR